MIAGLTRRPRNVDAPRAAAILYGDWGTSKAYVIGLAFAVAGYSSFWLIAMMCVLTALVGINYMIICRHYPDGGGVYASVRHRSVILSILGAFLLIADYIVTAAISSLSAFQYLGVPHPELFAGGAILVIGALNFFGPRQTGGLAFLVAAPTVLIVVLLGLFCVPHLGQAVKNLQPLHGGFWANWKGFVGVVLALSGVEAIANATGVMQLNPGTSEDNKPSVSKTSTPAILWVMIEVCLFTALLGLAAHALSGLTVNGEDVDAPGFAHVRDYMLRYMAQVFIGHSLGAAAAQVAAWVVSIVFAFLLLSAVNTAIVDLIAIQFLMSRDEELPRGFQRLNQFGVPNLGMLMATLIPAALVIAVKDMSGLADLYAVGVVGAITTNLGATATDRKMNLSRRERMLMLITFGVMLAIELSLLIDKPRARNFAMTVLAIGFVLRGLAAESAQRRKKLAVPVSIASKETIVEQAHVPREIMSQPPLACAVRGIGKTLDFAVQHAIETRRPLYLLFVRKVPALTDADRHRKWRDDEEATRIFDYAQQKASGHPVLPCYTISDALPETIVDVTATIGAAQLVLGAPNRQGLQALLRGDLVRHVADLLPEDIHLLIYA
jgi:amino acid transporter/nucleotide-binding universal stress UspA family protein